MSDGTARPQAEAGGARASDGGSFHRSIPERKSACKTLHSTPPISRASGFRSSRRSATARSTMPRSRRWSSGLRPPASRASWSAARPARPPRSTRTNNWRCSRPSPRPRPRCRASWASPATTSARRWTGCGALGQRALAGLLVPAPSYIRPSQAGLVDWFSAIADASAVPLVVYDIPYRTGVDARARDAARARRPSAHPRHQGLRRRHWPRPAR